MKTNGRPMKRSAARPMINWTIAKMLLQREALDIFKSVSFVQEEREPVPEMSEYKRKTKARQKPKLTSPGSKGRQPAKARHCALHPGGLPPSVWTPPHVP